MMENRFLLISQNLQNALYISADMLYNRERKSTDISFEQSKF